jgi:hypothetical protein
MTLLRRFDASALSGLSERVDRRGVVDDEDLVVDPVSATRVVLSQASRAACVAR